MDVNANTTVHKHNSPIDFDIEQMSNEMFVNRIKKEMIEIIKEEPLVSDLETTLDIEELKKIISLEHGESMNLFVRRADNRVINVIVKQTARVKDLKDAIEAFYKSKKAQEQFPEVTPIINWKFTWKTFSLMYKEKKLTDMNRSLRDYGVVNRSELEFTRNVFRRH